MKPLSDTEKRKLSVLDKKVRAGRANYRETVRAIRLAARRHSGA